MRVSDFISLLRNDFKCEDDGIILQWLELNAELSGESERALDTELDDTARALCYVKNNFDEQTLQNTLAYPTLANEIIGCAILFRSQLPIEVVRGYAESGKLECGYIPKTFDERHTLSLVNCGDADKSVFLCNNISAEELESKATQAFDEAQRTGRKISTVLQEMTSSDGRFDYYGEAVMGNHMVNLFNGDCECSAFGYSIRCLPSLGQIYSFTHPSLIAEEKAEAVERMKSEEYELIEVEGQTALFTNSRLKQNDLLDGLFLYHLRHSDDGSRFCSIEEKVGVNHGGSVITSEPIDLGENGYVAFTDETEPNFLGESITLEQYMEGDYKIQEDFNIG